MTGHPSPTFAVVTGGGTTGHVNPAIAVLELLNEAGHAPETLHYVGSDRGVEVTLVAQTPFPSTLLRVRGFRRSVGPRGILHNLKMIPTMIGANRSARRLLVELKPQVVVSVGGYASVPACRAARRLGIPVVTCSYDRTPGLATRAQSRYAEASAVAYADSTLRNATLTGAPVRRAIRSLDRGAHRAIARRTFNISEQSFVVAIIGGSLGSALLNGIAEGLAATMPRGVHLIHLCGERYSTSTPSSDNVTRIAYTDAMVDVYAASDLVVSRAGAGPIAELSVVGCPSVLVPWALATEDHQTKNAQWLADAGAAVVLPESEATVDRVRDVISELMTDRGRLDAMGQAARAIGRIHDGTLLTRTIERVGSLSSHVSVSTPRRVHVVGVGGPGMSALAIALHEAGHVVSGSDLVDSEVVADLRDRGVRINIGHDVGVVSGVDVVTYSTAIPATNVELVAARRNGVSVVTRAAMLAALCSEKSSVAVAGTHGKTTTSGMLATILRDAGSEPSYVIGADVRSLSASAHWGKGRHVVVEADESDSTHVALSLSGVLVTNVDVDHLDHFTTVQNMEASFERLLHNAKGPKVVCGDDVRAMAVAGGRGVRTYGLRNGVDVQGVDVVYRDGGSTTTVRDNATGRVLGEMRLALRGEHNVLNALGALAMAIELGVDARVALESLAGFRGVERRFDVRGESRGVTFVDDYAHLPREIDVVLRGARDLSDDWKRIVAVFQPNRYNRMNTMSPEYRDSFSGADLVVVTEIYPSGTTPIPGVTGKLVVDAIRTAHPTKRVEWIPDRGDLVTFLAGELAEGDLCISMGCGDIESLPDEVIAARDRR
ncbi:MAG: UDP-N-acetylmuramate--L-alanine ligase [Ilumatobacteraceae bacterium]